MSVQFFTQGGKGITKQVSNTYPNGTVVKQITKHGGNYIPQEVVSTKIVNLSPKNKLFNQGLGSITREVTKAGNVFLQALDKSGNIVAANADEVKQLIKSMKKFGLKV